MPQIPRDAAYIEARSIPEPNSGCWLWTGSTARGGYGKVETNGRCSSASRASYIIHKGDVAEGLEVDHICQQPSCVNPDHLRAVTSAFNRSYRRRSPNSPFEPNKCSNGHQYEGLMVNGWRYCRVCARASARRYKARVRLAKTAFKAEAA